MRSSAPEGQHAPRAKQAPPSGSSGAAAGPTGAQPTSPHSNSTPSRPQAPLTHKTSSPQSISQRSSGLVNTPNRVSSQSRSIAGQQTPPQRSQQKVGGPVHVPQLQQQHQRSPTTPPTPQSHQQTIPTLGKQPPQLQTPNKLVQARIAAQPHKTSPQSHTKPLNSVGSQPRPAEFPSKQGSPKSSQPAANHPNFGEYDDQEWDVGVGHLIIDLDADIAQADRGRMSGAPSTTMVLQQGPPGTPVNEDKHSLKMKIKRTKPPTKTSEAKHEIVKPDVVQIAPQGTVGMNGTTTTTPSQHNGANIKIENNGIPRTPTSVPRVVFKKEKRRLDVNGAPASPPPSQNTPQRMVPHPSIPTPVAPTTITPLPVSQPATTHFGSVAPLVSHQAFPTTSPMTHTTSNSTVSSQILSNSNTLSVIPNNGNMVGHPLQVKMEPRSVAPNGGTAPSAISKPLAMQQQQLLPQQQQQLLPQQQQLPKPCLSPLLVSQQAAETQIDRLSPASKRQKVNEECDRKDACVGTSVGTITEPDCLGPCEPGSSVTLEGIVWHETEGGVLVVNVTWRGKTYVGTLLDCTKHDWAPPRYCDSPTSDLESRTPKGRAKRGRTAASSSNLATATHTPVTELSVTETRSGKLRNSTMKGRRGGGTPTFNPPPSPVKSEAGGIKRKGRESESSTQQPDPKSFKRSRSCSRSTPTNGCSSPSLDQQHASQPHTQNGAQETPLPPSSPQLIECPEPNCNKKYKHINGLKYHQSHAHTSSLLCNDDEASTAEKSENSEVEENRHPSPTPVVSLPADASAHDLIKPAALRPTPIPLPTHVAKDDVIVPPSQIQVNGATQLPNSPQQVFAYSNNSGNASPQKPSGILPSVIASNKPLKGIQQSTEQSVQITSLIGDVNSLSQQQALKELQPVPQGVNQLSQTSSAAKQSQVQQTNQGTPQPQQLSTHVPQPLTTQPVPITHPQTIQANHNTHIMQCSSQSQLPSQMQHPSQHHIPSLNQLPPQVSMQSSIPQSQMISQTNAVGASSHVSLPVYTNSQMPPSSPAGMQAQQHLTSQYLSTQNQLQLLSAYNQQMIDSCPPNASSQHNSLQTGRLDILGGLVHGHGSSGILRNHSDSNSPVQNIQSNLPHTVSNIPQGTPLSSLPGATALPAKDKSLVDGDMLPAKQKELVNGISPLIEDEANREDARSPAYSDISDANDSASVIDGESDSKDFKDEKKPELPLGPSSQYSYGLYHHFGPYGQPHHPYMMPSIQPPPGLPMKPGDIKDLKDKQEKDKKDGPPHLPGGNEYLKFPPHYLYSYSHLYPPGYPDPYMREPMYKELVEKAKFEQKEMLSADEMDKGPTDLSRNCSNNDKNPLNHRDTQLSVNHSKEPLDTRLHGTPEKRPIDPVQSFRYINSYDNRIQVGGSGPSLEKLNDPKVSISSSKSVTPIPLSSPRLGSTPPVSNNKEEKSEKRNEVKSEGVKPTMETTGPPPPPTSSAYYPPFPYSHVAFDPYRPQLVPSLPAGFPQSYLHGPNLGLRYPMGMPNAPEDLSRSGSGGPMMSSQGLYAGSHKIAELQERAQKLQSGQPVSSSSGVLARGGSPLTIYSKDHPCANLLQLPPHSMSPISSSPSSTSYTSSIVSQHGSLMASSMGLPGDRKTPPVVARLAHPMPESYPYPLLSAQFPPHFAALGVTPPNMSSVGGPGVTPSGLGGGSLLPK